ncbi:DNA photolyase FAD-binding protein [Thermodesulfobium narugense DSM 14796]|uniref:Deoxyribodipyrimidine photo-lyase n=1 Tax=Thermodesulfobium narugense DSM 14796 TaxID=747365 RepID=M1E4X1_9BACT|nr:deoxyribodipyrimidine photo-lyase [Thermodesulfobium narugense]AEE14637.1 DNA photolyase FAD-binding protein [Thermodesulfobium narugense DSM 14796]
MKFYKRIEKVQTFEKVGKYILYWMQGAFRVKYNHSFEYAKYLSNKHNIPLLVLIIVDFSYPEGNFRSFKFFLEGLKDVFEETISQQIGINIVVGSFQDVLKSYIDNAKIMITDKSYLPNLINIKNTIYSENKITIYQVDTNLVIPVNIVSQKKEYAAYTIRPKILKLLYEYRNDFEEIKYNGSFLKPKTEVDLNNIENELRKQNLVNVLPAPYIGGYKEAKKILDYFVSKKFKYYKDNRNNPEKESESNISPYLHFGNISPLEILDTLEIFDKSSENYYSFFEEMVIRRELAHNFTYYSNDLNNLENLLPAWAFKTFYEHKDDKREYVYSLEEFENSKTHDEIWNASQRELKKRGKIHNYMRMYWGKKIIEWSKNIEDAYDAMIYLNNKYALDGRDPNSYVGILWCFGLHDRAFKERKIFGKVRWMSQGSLIRKFGLNKYIRN